MRWQAEPYYVRHIVGVMRLLLVVLTASMGLTTRTQGQTPPAKTTGQWRASTTPARVKVADLSPQGATTLASEKVGAPKPVSTARSSGVLPNSAGQVWRQYDIRSYTGKLDKSEHPEQAIVDWVLRETGTDVWFSEPLGLLSANRNTLSVYHTPEMQRIVADVVDQFVSGTHDPQVFGLQVLTVGNPNWRTTAMQRMRPITVQTPGIDAWLLSKEDAALLLGDLRKRADFQQQSAPTLVCHNGQPVTVSQQRPRSYVHSYNARTNGFVGFEPEVRQIQEGFTLEISPLLSQDGRTVDAVLKCAIDDVERFVAVGIDLPGFNGQVQRAQIQVPQLVSWRLHERFRWPADQVLLLSCGVVAAPGPERPNPLGILSPVFGVSDRTDALLLVEYRGRADQSLVSGASTAQSNGGAISGGRY